jgi:Ca2+-binding EF-hand superfamily protein
VKEYKRFLDMFHKIDTNKTGAISKKELMDAMKKDKDVSASGSPVP